MKLSKSMLAAAVVTTVAAGSMLTLGAASAQSSNGQDSIVDKIATKFNLNRDEVQTVFDESHAEREAQREANRSEHLQSLVDDGTITAEQKTALEAKFAEHEASREAAKDSGLSREEMRTQMQAKRDEFKAWAEEQGIDLEAIRPEGGPGMRGGHGRGMGHADESDASSIDDSASEQ